MHIVSLLFFLNSSFIIFWTYYLLNVFFRYMQDKHFSIYSDTIEFRRGTYMAAPQMEHKSYDIAQRKGVEAIWIIHWELISVQRP